MNTLPFPIRVAAGLAVTTVERARAMPKQLAGLPVTMISQVLQASMRVQQNITELAIKGDDVLSTLGPVEEAPSWATFDEDQPTFPRTAESAPAAGQNSEFGTATAMDTAARNGHPHTSPGAELDDDPWTEEQRALDGDYVEGTFDSPRESVQGPAGLAGYDELTLPQLRARLRQFSVEQLTELLAYERAHANRSSFTGMLSRRIDNVRKEDGESPGWDESQN